MKQNIKLKIPKQMQMLCAMLDLEPQTILQTFMDDVNLASEGMNPDDRRRMATFYLYRCAEDNEKYKGYQIDVMFKELNTLLEKCPNDEAAFKAFFKKWPKAWQTLRKK